MSLPTEEYDLDVVELVSHENDQLLIGCAAVFA
jgi:hypothetical protein